MKRFALALALFVAPAGAQTQVAPAAAQTQDWSTNIETVVVHANERGPLIWRVVKGDAEVDLIGQVEPVPKDLSWNTRGIEEALKGARVLYTNAQASVGIAEGLWFLTWHSNAVYLPGDVPMETTLPADLRARFAGRRDKIKRDADRYSSLRVPLAALRLEGDFLDANGLTREEPSKAVEKLARKLDVPVKPLAEYEALPMVEKLPTMSKAANEACARDALDDIDQIEAHARPGAEAWAIGDLAAIKANYSEERFQSCIQAVPGAAALYERAVRDSMNAIDGALATPGKTVMLVGIGVILKKGGIADRLKAKGLTLEEP